MGETGDSGHSPGCDDNGKKTTFPNEFLESLVRLSRFEIRADNRRFHNLLASLVAALAHKDSTKVIGIFYQNALSVWMGFRALFFETGALSTCLAFFDPVD